ncbi:flavanone 3-dioxygenase 1 isoform X2 [Selaginella moellendorffii]|uniref:flavanone 3-dioxygenase 1 isoform X2 n=1 Tax=Selaginella moellendorffii TaxID=88036 RepID=UPI000D1CBAEB|nr:flavanone 3-dioxygenase 1 isoform X2 [Selaginella moellendorffii]|eukprot:XP_024542403.1 flavanone 3-dioxygenase 1 isoform X2 [Selaginella moellendorffii]
MAIDEEASIPVIDHSAFVLGDECARVKALAEIDRACRDWGFFQLVNHGLRADRLENILQCTRDFFALPLERKLDLVTPMSPIGFLNQSGASGVVDRKEHLLFFGLDHPSVRHNAWPESPHGFRGVVEEMMRECAAFSKLLTRILFEALGLSGDCAREIYNKESGDSFLLPFYPACPPDYEHELVLGQHKDGSQGRSLDHSEATQKLPRHQRWRRDAGVDEWAIQECDAQGGEERKRSILDGLLPHPGIQHRDRSSRGIHRPRATEVSKIRPGRVHPTANEEQEHGKQSQGGDYRALRRLKPGLALIALIFK